MIQWSAWIEQIFSPTLRQKKQPLIRNVYDVARKGSESELVLAADFYGYRVYKNGCWYVLVSEDEVTRRLR